MGLTFLDTDPAAIFARLKAAFEAQAGRVLYPAHVETLLLKVMAYADAERRIATQFAAEQNLVAYAVGPHLDALGQMLACPRLQPTPATCRVRFALAAPAPSGISYPAGTRITTHDAKFAFVTQAPAYVISGQAASSDVPANCDATGAAANGLPPGSICKIEPEMQGVSVASVTSTEGGGDLELDEQYRGRMLLAPAKYGGGSASAYRHHALSASSLVSDALAVAGRDGTINIYVLADSGAPSNDLLRIVQDYCSRPDIRLIGDTIAALPAIEKPYTIKGGITVFADHDPQTVLDKVRAHAHAYAKKTSAALGTDITPAQILMALAPERDGLYNVTLDAPAGVISIAEAEWGHATEIDIALLGVAR